MTDILLTDEQQAIVDADLDGPRLVDAGAGTGKTFTMVQRAVSLVTRGQLAPDELLVITFTKAAATEIAGRLEAAFDPSDHRRPVCGTFHGIATDLIREFAYEAGFSPDIRVIDDGRARGVFARAFADLEAGRLSVDLTAFPLLSRTKLLERSLAAIILRLKQQGTNIADVIARALRCASDLESLPYGGVKMVKGKNRMPKAGWPRPDPERSPAERHLEAERERLNVGVVAALFERFQSLLDEEHLLTFGDVLVRATAMMQSHPEIVTRLRLRWKHAIVDEFQDTNRTQVAFLEAIFGADLRPVLVVGDVRQAIYEFNGAEPSGIIDFRSRARETLPLSTNRRSFEPILDVAHHVLDTLGGVAPEFNQLLSAYRGHADPLTVRLQLFEGADASECEASAIAAEIRRLVDAGASPRDCAVLLRTRTKAGIFAAALRAVGLAVQLYGGVGFFDAPEIREAVAWLRLAANPTDPFAAVAALQSTAIGLGDGAVARLAQDSCLARGALLDEIPPEFTPAERARLERFRRTARVVCALGEDRLVSAVRTIASASGAEISRLTDDELPQVRANLDKLVRFAADFASDRPLARIADFVAELNERDELELDLPLAELEGERVAIMTIHGAKGLEWGHVFVANVSASTFPLITNDGRETVVQIDERTGAIAFKTAVDGRPNLRWYMTRHEHDDNGIVAGDNKSDRSEEYRLLYVALTRARNAVYVSGRRIRQNKASECFAAVETWANKVSGASVLHHFSGESMPTIVNAPQPLPESSRLKEMLVSRLTRMMASPSLDVQRRGTLSYTAMELQERCPRRARYHYVLGLPELSDEAAWSEQTHDGYDSESRDPARYGRVIHKALELLAKAQMRSQNIEVSAALNEALSEEDWEPTTAELSAASVSVGNAQARLSELTPLDAERQFEVWIDGTRMGGYIDLLASDRNGKPIIVDYKTGRTGAEHYALQFALYQYASKEEHPDASCRVLRISESSAVFEAVIPASEAELRAAIARATSMESDEPRPGRQCNFCPYAYDVCDAAPHPTKT